MKHVIGTAPGIDKLPTPSTRVKHKLQCKPDRPTKRGTAHQPADSSSSVGMHHQSKPRCERSSQRPFIVTSPFLCRRSVHQVKSRTAKHKPSVHPSTLEHNCCPAIPGYRINLYTN